MKIGLFVPCRANVSDEAMPSIASVFSTATVQLWQQGHQPSQYVLTRCHLPEVRNAMFKIAIADELDWIFTMDDDAIVRPDIVSVLLKVVESTGADAVSPLCYERNRGLESMALDVDGNRIDVPGWLSSTGFHCVLMKTDIVRRIMEKYPNEPVVQMPPNVDRLYGDDRFFWGRAMEVGCRLWHAAHIEAEHLMSVRLNSKTRKHLLAAKAAMEQPIV